MITLERNSRERNSSFTVKKMVRIGLLGAIGMLLMYYIAFPLPLFPDFLTYDPGDVPGIIAAFAMGPMAGVLVQGIKVLTAFVMGAIKAGPVGALANFLAGAAYTLTAGAYYRRNRTMRGAVVAMIIGCLATTIVMCIMNYFILLPFWGIPTEQIGGLLVAAIFPFNLVKMSISSVLAFILYKKVKRFLEE
jgi:riboflavin transporter FmnP